MSGLVLAALIAGAFALVRFIAYLCFMAFVVVRTNDTAGLKDVSTAVRAFGWAFTSKRRDK